MIFWLHNSPGNQNDSGVFKGLYDKIRDSGIEMLIADVGYKTPTRAKLLLDKGIKPLLTYKCPITKENFFEMHGFKETSKNQERMGT